MQETIPLGFHQCKLIAEKDEQIPDLTLLLAPLGPKALEGFKPLRSLITPSLETAVSFMKGAAYPGAGPGCVHFY